MYDQKIIDQALNMVRESIPECEDYLTGARATKNLCQLKLARKKKEEFMVLFLNTRNGIISEEVLFTGTIDSCNVYPREVAKRALELNAAAVILAHNHPSGDVSPSESDIRITKKISEALELFEIRTLDHIIVGRSALSMAENGYLSMPYRQ